MIYVKVAFLVNILPALLKIVILTSPNIYSIATSLYQLILRAKTLSLDRIPSCLITVDNIPLPISILEVEFELIPRTALLFCDLFYLIDRAKIFAPPR